MCGLILYPFLPSRPTAPVPHPRVVFCDFRGETPTSVPFFAQVPPLQLCVRAIERPVRRAVQGGLSMRRPLQPTPSGVVIARYEGGRSGAVAQARAASAGVFEVQPVICEFGDRGKPSRVVFVHFFR